MIEAVAVWRHALVPYAARLRKVLGTVARAVRPLEHYLDGFRCPSSRQVAHAKRPGFMATMSVLLRWPDLVQAQFMVLGYPIVGSFESSGVFRPIRASEPSIVGVAGSLCSAGRR